MKEQSMEDAALCFLELASEQRLRILSNLNKKPHRVSSLAKLLKVTSQEIHRNLDRLSSAYFVRKGADEHYHITTNGKIILSQLPLITFLSKNQKFFETHELGNMHMKFVRRLGVLENCKHIKGVTVVLDKWKSIYKNAKIFVFDAITESPAGLVDPLMKRIKENTTYRHIITKDLIEPEGRTKTLEKLGYFTLIEQGKIERRISSDLDTIVIMNEKEASVIFAANNGEPDLRNMFYGDDPLFLDWCKDYLEFIWEKSKKTARIKPTH